MEKRVVSHSAPYGHACMSCFKGKCRCIPRQGGNGCERCHRLKKHCVPSNQVRRSTLHHGPVLDGRIGSRSSSEGGTAAEPQSGLLQISTSLDGLESFEAGTRPFVTTPNGTSSSTTAKALESLQSTSLDTFRSQMLPHLPFLHLPAHMTAQQLHLRHPFLLQAITCVASPTTRERLTRATELKRDLHNMVFQPQHRNGLPSEAAKGTLDLLLGLLTYITWGWDHSHMGRLTMLAMSLVGEISLNRSAASDAKTLGLLASTVKLTAAEHSHGDAMVKHRLDHQRAALACYPLSSSVSAYSNQIEALRWAPQMEHALVAISDTDSQLDHILAVQLRLELLTDQAVEIRGQGHKSDHNSAEMLLMKLEELRPTVEQHQEQSSSLVAHFHHTELAIHEALHATAPHPVAVTACPPPGVRPINNTNAIAPPPNLSQLWNALLAIQSTTTALLSLPTATASTNSASTTAIITSTQDPFRGISLPQWTQLIRCLAALQRFEAPDPRWPDGAASEVVDLPVLLGRIVERLESMAREAGEVVAARGSGIEDEGPGGEEGTFMALALRLRGFRDNVLRERAGVSEPGVATSGMESAGGVSVSGTEGERMVLAPQKGYFRDPRFWLDQIWDRVE